MAKNTGKHGLKDESVWDYPRPPAIEEFKGSIEIIFNGEPIVRTDRAFRILETSHPPTYYILISSFKQGVLQSTEKSSFCEFKGRASYFDVVVGDKLARNAAWYYPEPQRRYSSIKNCVAVYAHAMDACFVNDEKVQSQEGDFYGGWITSNVKGPFKGGAGTWGW